MTEPRKDAADQAMMDALKGLARASRECRLAHPLMKEIHAVKSIDELMVKAEKVRQALKEIQWPGEGEK